MRQNWNIIVNSAGTILAVYGSALGEEAEEKARELSKVGTVALRLVASSKRPHVGGASPKRYLTLSFAKDR